MTSNWLRVKRVPSIISKSLALKSILNVLEYFVLFYITVVGITLPLKIKFFLIFNNPSVKFAFTVHMRMSQENSTSKRFEIVSKETILH